MRYRTLLWTLLTLFLALSPRAGAQFSLGAQEESEESEQLDVEALQLEREDVLARIAQVEAKRLPRDEKEPAEDPTVTEEIALLNRLSFVLDRILKLQPTIAEVEDEKIRIGRELAEIRSSGTLDEATRSVRVLDALRDELDLEDDGREFAKASLETAREALEEAETVATERARLLRSATDALPRITDPGDQAVAQRDLEITELRSRVAEVSLDLRKLQLLEAKHQDQLHRGREELLEAKIAILAREAQLTEAELQEVLEELARQTARLENEIASMKGNLSWVETRWMSASDRLAEQDTPDATSVAEVQSLYQNKETTRYRERALSERMDRLEERRQRWEQRLRVANGDLELEEAATLIADLLHRRSDLHLEKTKARERLEPMRAELRALETRIEQEPEDSDLARQLANQKRYLDQRLEAYELNIGSMEVLESLTERLLIDLRGEEGDAVAEAWRHFVTAVQTTWTYEIGTLGDTPITIRKILIGLMIFIIGILLSRYFSQFLGNRLLPGIGLEVPAATVVRTLIFYLLTLIFAFFALNFVDVPLTAFTVLGGALAVGIGFGSQNIVNNFISGLIILIEQPVRVGDLIQIGDLYGNVIRIGARSTQIRTGANVEIMVPNSSFLENNVVNLTLSDDRIRAHVEVGVAYGSPVRDVVKLLKIAASEHGRVLKNPDPFVLFESFGDNSLVFEVHFWIQARAVMDRRKIESDIRKKVDTVFRGSSIEIAFPQRDVHLDTKGPLRVQMVAPEEPESEEEPMAAKT